MYRLWLDDEMPDTPLYVQTWEGVLAFVYSCSRKTYTSGNTYPIVLFVEKDDIC